jgi:hypothetical protein
LRFPDAAAGIAQAISSKTVVREVDVELLTQELRQQLPPLDSTMGLDDPLVICKFFTPDAGWTWYTLEFDGPAGGELACRASPVRHELPL